MGFTSQGQDKMRAAVHFWHYTVPNEFKVSRAMRGIWKDIPKFDPRDPYVQPGPRNNVSGGRIVIAGLRRSGLTTTGILDFLHYELHVWQQTHGCIDGMIVGLNDAHTQNVINVIQSSALSKAFTPVQKHRGEFRTHLGSLLTAATVTEVSRSHAKDWMMFDHGYKHPQDVHWDSYARTIVTRVIDPDPPYVEHMLLPDAPSIDWRPDVSLPEDYHL